MLVRLARGRAANSVETGEQLDITLEWLFGNPESPLSRRTWGSPGRDGRVASGWLKSPPKTTPCPPKDARQLRKPAPTRYQMENGRGKRERGKVSS